MAGDLTVANINSEDVSMGLAQKTKNDLNASGLAPIYACRAWVNFDGSLATIAIRESGNVSSIIDGGVGLYTVNLLEAMEDDNYSPSVTAKLAYGGAYNTSIHLDGAVTPVLTVSSFALVIRLSSGAFADSAVVSCSVFR